jgi:hypothetical protein
MTWDPFAIFRKPKNDFSKKSPEKIVYTIRPLLPQQESIIRGFKLKPADTKQLDKKS